MSAKKWVLTFNKSNLRIVLVGFLLISGVQAETRGPIKIITQDGRYLYPREFVAIDEWETLKVPPLKTNFFVFRLPAAYAKNAISGFTALENYFKQDVIVTVEVLSKKRLAELDGIDSQQYYQGNHDTYPQSVPYKRCEYRKHFSPEGVAVKYQLNGENNQYFRQVEALIRKKLSEWKQ